MDKKPKRMVPEVRFKGFTDDWEQRKLGEVAKIIAGGDKKFDLIKPIGKYPVIANSVNTDGIVGFYDNEYTITAPAITVTGRGDIGHAIARFTNFTPVVRLLALKTNHNVTFLTNAINIIRIFNETTGVPQLTKPQLASYSVKVTNLDEESKIANIIKSIDKLLSLQQKKLEQIRVLKKAMLQQLFVTDKNTLVPNIRFKGFVDAWEQRKLGEVAEKFDNLRIPVAASKREKGNIPYYGANGIQDYVKGYTHNGEFVLVAEDGANDLQNYPVHYINGKVWVNNHAHVLQGKRYIADNLFLINAIKKIKFETYLVGGSRAKLNADIMMKLPIILPTFSEQQKLGRFFARVDNLIVLHQRKIHTLSNLKKFCLQKMFI